MPPRVDRLCDASWILEQRPGVRRVLLRRLSPCRVSVGESVAGPWTACFLVAVGCSLPALLHLSSRC